MSLFAPLCSLPCCGSNAYVLLSYHLPLLSPPGVVISELLHSWLPDQHLLLFDFLEVADASGAKGVDVVLDLRQHDSLSLLQPNLGRGLLGGRHRTRV